MNEEIRIKMAEREGYRIEKRGCPPFELGFWLDKNGKHCDIPTYETDTDLDRYIRGMSDELAYDYRKALMDIIRAEATDRNGLWIWELEARLLKAPRKQKLEAIIKAEGWE